MSKIKTTSVRPGYFVCSICGKECGKADPKIRGTPRIYHLECAEEATKEVRDKLRKTKIEK